tara:strand:+ start:65 stop:805 length:741 start_codon:yes stop_codon:yes gene_type:complete
MESDRQLNLSIKETNQYLEKVSPESRLEWAIQNFDKQFALTTSFGIQSSVLLHMIHLIKGKENAKIIWVDTGYLPKETYNYADQLTNRLNLNITVVQSDISPARMEALYGKLWEKNSIKDFEKYNSIRKVEPLEKAFKNFNINCWASGVRKDQTQHRKSMNFLDPFRDRLALRPLLDWTKKEIFYYMQDNNLPQHPLFEKGYSTVGDWHSSGPDNINKKGRETRFGGLKEECGIHLGNTTEGKNNN